MPGNASGFIDVLFILLAGLIAALASTTPLGRLEAEPARVGGGGVSPVSLSETVLVSVRPEGVMLTDGTVVGDAALPGLVPPHTRVVLLPESAEVTHHRVLAVWDALDAAGVPAAFGVMPGGPEPPSPAASPAVAARGG